ncbi:MAG: type II toxin-antitoxin system HicB family antitoxin [Chitinophagaceae bacterium]|nr:type II toxin-antitoxin system HicB family antitoxin [Chitinophagaceae bacterium]
MKTSFQHVIWKEGEHFVAQCLNVEVSSFGNTRDEALRNLEEALELYFEDMPIENASVIEAPELIETEWNHA